MPELGAGAGRGAGAGSGAGSRGVSEDLLFFVRTPESLRALPATGPGAPLPRAPPSHLCPRRWPESRGAGAGAGPGEGAGAGVPEGVAGASGGGERERRRPCFARRWGPDLRRVVGDRSEGEVDWWRTFYLNLICHTHFSLTLAVCSRAALEGRRNPQQGRQGRAAPVPPLFKVTRRVIASPSLALVETAGPGERHTGGISMGTEGGGEGDGGSKGFPEHSFALESGMRRFCRRRWRARTTASVCC